MLATLVGLGMLVVLGAPPGAALAASGPPGATIRPGVAPHGTPSAARGHAYRLPVSPGPVLRTFEAPEHRWAAGHRGVDLGAATGQAVRAPQSGVVAFAGQVAGRPVVTVRHDDGLLSSLEPVTAVRDVGDRVAAGEVVGTLAGSGGGAPRATAAPPAGHCRATSCLHWGVRDAPDSYVDPLALVAPTGPVVLLPG